MNWDDTGFLLSKNRYNENSIIAEVLQKNMVKFLVLFLEEHQKRLKIIFKLVIKFMLIIIQKVNRIGYFKIEILKALTPLYFDNNQKLSCIASAMNLVKLLTAEAQSNKEIFNLIDNFFKILDSDNWIKKYIFWELEILN